MNPRMVQRSTEILWNREVAPAYYKLAFSYPEGLPPIGSGQFFMIRTGQGNDPLLRRALAAYRVGGAELFPEVRRGNGIAVELLYRAGGRGISFLTAKRPGDLLDWIGPLGNTYTLSETASKHYLVAGGTGLASVYLLASHLVERFSKESVHLFIGGRSEKDIVSLSDFEALGVSISITTEDGTKGVKGRVTDLLEKELQDRPSRGLSLYTAGPMPMMRKVVEICRKADIPCQASLEGPMGCGFGICLGCSVEVIRDGEKRYRLLCQEGPVFDAKEVYWGEA